MIDPPIACMNLFTVIKNIISSHWWNRASSQSRIPKMIIGRTRNPKSIPSCWNGHARMLIRCCWLFGLSGFAFGSHGWRCSSRLITISRCGTCHRPGLLRLAALICKGSLGREHRGHLLRLRYCIGLVCRIFIAFRVWHLWGTIFRTFPHQLFWTSLTLLDA